MSNEPYITITGFAATNPRQLVTQSGVAMATFRVAVTPRRFDRAAGTWVDGTTQWYSVKSFRETAENVAMSIHKGDPVIVHGKFSTSEWTTEDGMIRTTLEVDASALGHDFGFGLGSFRRTSRRPSGEAVAERASRVGSSEIQDDPDAAAFMSDTGEFNELVDSAPDELNVLAG